ncbi:MAG: hypothetical protein QGH94_19625, partial [Phycisphaerae bacterium]|nr:hypothetical protein [Phycisphaerae bacterium]
MLQCKNTNPKEYATYPGIATGPGMPTKLIASESLLQAIRSRRGYGVVVARFSRRNCTVGSVCPEASWICSPGGKRSVTLRDDQLSIGSVS